MTAGGNGRSVADRLDWLFDVAAVEDPATGRWRRHTTAEAGAVLDGGQAAVERLLGGAPAEPDQATALARFFDVDPALFGTDPAAAAEAADDLLTRALRRRGVLSYAICRMPVVDRRDQLRRLLRPESSEGPTGSRRMWHDDPRLPRPSHDSGTTGMTATPRSVADLHALCQSLVSDLGLSSPFEPHELCQRLAAHRGRPIKIRATDLGATTGVGHLAPARRVDHILVERNAPAPQQALVIYHEVMHLVCDHLEVGDTLTCGLGSADADASGAYDDWREWEAEVGARTLARLGRERPRPNRLPLAAGPAERSIAAAFGFTHGHRAGNPLG
ncbi:ImmA/IrrE family metallo-endopeptidase [Amycolatopsis suaedae]|uniref:ImmA/IrrE family metallo-endopeptidase n=1 Tax=Amycolatopsis suaedae TaxID=2510978 RepID=A0A4Q7IYY9_9PSEU|nr:ImmA/IrrE family metallo-endopeptidase [Amycolatopsis suaedae]RZQ59658.1 ImmA/IrrE family metallo-endopeptidase [Amycolatopsis suaedae]